MFEFVLKDFVMIFEIRVKIIIGFFVVVMYFVCGFEFVLVIEFYLIVDGYFVFIYGSC